LVDWLMREGWRRRGKITASPHVENRSNEPSLPPNATKQARGSIPG